MNYNLKPLIWVGTVLLVILCIFLLASIERLTNTALTTNTVSFDGTGKMTAKPDIAVVSVSIISDAITSKAAQDANSTKSNKVTDFLKQQRIEDKDIKTSGYNISPNYKYKAYVGNPEITGYRVTQTIEVKIRDLDKVSSILDGVVTAGANQIGELSFQIDDVNKLKEQARKIAVDQAKEKAKVLKDQIGISLGKIISFSEYYNGYPTPMYDSMKASGIGGGGGTVTPSVPSGENEISVNVTITYQIK